jgi:hypothetical protein
VNDARASALYPVTSEREQTPSQVTCAGSSARKEWLAQLRPLDQVAVYCGSRLIEVVTVTSAPRTFVTIGKYNRKANFSRDDGQMCGHRPMGHLFRIEQP